VLCKRINTAQKAAHFILSANVLRMITIHRRLEILLLPTFFFSCLIRSVAEITPEAVLTFACPTAVLVETHGARIGTISPAPAAHYTVALQLFPKIF